MLKSFVRFWDSNSFEDGWHHPRQRIRNRGRKVGFTGASRERRNEWVCSGKMMDQSVTYKIREEEISFQILREYSIQRFDGGFRTIPNIKGTSLKKDRSDINMKNV